MGDLRIHLLGPCRIVSDGGKDVTPAGRRGQAIIAMLALTDRRCRSRAWIQAKLWSDREPAQSSASLRQELCRLRRVLGPDHLIAENQSVRIDGIRVDVLDIAASGTMPDNFVGAELPDLLEGLDVLDEEFEEWLRLEREHWRDRLEGIRTAEIASAAAPSPRAGCAIMSPKVPAAVRRGTQQPPRRPAIGILPCVFRPMNTTLQSMGDLLCELMTKLLIENGHYAVFDFRDLSGHFAQSDHGHGNSAQGPDLLMSVRFGEVVNLLEVGVAVRRITDGRIIWTQSLAADVSDSAMFDGRRLSEFVNQAIEAVESWLMRHRDTDVHDASRLTLAATHHIMSLSTGDLMIAECNLRTAQDLAPSAVRLAWMAMLEAIRFGESSGHDRQAHVERIRALTAEALELDRGNSLALALLGHANAYVVRDFAMAAELIADALEINPSRAEAWDAQAMLSIYTGDPVRGYEAARRAKALGRFSPYAFWYEASCGIGATLAGWHQEAVRHGELVLRRRPDFQPTIRHLVASYALAGDMDKARDMYAALRALQPDFCPAQLRDPAYPAGSPESLTLIEAGLKAANVAL